MRKFKSAKQAQRFLSADRAYRWTLSTAKASPECSGIPCSFTELILDLG